MKAILIIEKGSTTPSEHCPGTCEKGTKFTNAHIGRCNELATHPAVDLPSPCEYPPCDLKGIKWKKMREVQVWLKEWLSLEKTATFCHYSHQLPVQVQVADSISSRLGGEDFMSFFTDKVLAIIKKS